VEHTTYHNPSEHKKYGLKNLSKVFTPTGVELAGDLPFYISYFLGSYHGGRNESFIYGMIRETVYDYDLPGAYPTAMSLLDYPDWGRKELFLEMTGEEFMVNYKDFLFQSYTALKVEFSFPETVQYPTLPVRLNESSIIYPLSGVSCCTGHEILLASRLNCEFKVLGGVFIPFKKLKFPSAKLVRNTSNRKIDRLLKETSDGKQKVVEIRDPLFDVLEKNYTDKIEETFSRVKDEMRKDPKIKDLKKDPKIKEKSDFFKTVKRLVSERNKYEKGSYMNQLYKFLANSGIGQMARGLNRKKAFDTKSLKPEIISPGDLISPLYAGWITSYIRCTLTELLNNTPGNIFSCTTDGFISNHKGLDLIEPSPEDIFSCSYYKARENLTGKGELLEVKHFDTKGLLS